MLHFAILMAAGVLATFSSEAQVIGRGAVRVERSDDSVRSSDDVNELYNALLRQDATARSGTLVKYPASVQSGVWAHHLVSEMARHPRVHE